MCNQDEDEDEEDEEKDDAMAEAVTNGDVLGRGARKATVLAARTRVNYNNRKTFIKM